MRTLAQRRRFALSASIENVLIAVAARASDRLKLERPEFSVATLNRLACFVPPLFGIASILALFTSASMILLGTLVVLPTAFRILLVVCQASPGGRRSSPAFPTDEELPVYTVIAPLHREARVVDQLLSGIERLDYPVEILDVIFIVKADEPGSCRNHAPQTSHSDHGDSGAARRAAHETEGTQHCARARARHFHRHL